jgi:DNA-binding response OmpR family regulator
MKTIAVVNNEKNIAVLLQFHLEQVGYRVRLYGRGIDALPALIAEPCDLVILNSYNPPLGGVALFRELRKHSAVPAIFSRLTRRMLRRSCAALGSKRLTTS